MSWTDQEVFDVVTVLAPTLDMSVGNDDFDDAEAIVTRHPNDGLFLYVSTNMKVPTPERNGAMNFQLIDERELEANRTPEALWGLMRVKIEATLDVLREFLTREELPA